MCVQVQDPAEFPRDWARAGSEIVRVYFLLSPHFPQKIGALQRMANFFVVVDGDG